MSVAEDLKKVGLKPMEGKKVESWLKVSCKSTEKGIDITFIGPDVEKWMANHCPYAKETSSKYFDVSSAEGWVGKEGYKLDKVPDELANELAGWGQDLRITGGTPNLAFLRAKGLKDGVTFRLEGIFPKESVVNWHETLKKKVTQLCRNYIKGYEINIQILTHEKDIEI